MVDERPFTPETLAKRWQCSSASIRHSLRTGQLSGFRLGDKLWRIPAAVVREQEGLPADAPVHLDTEPASEQTVRAIGRLQAEKEMIVRDISNGKDVKSRAEQLAVLQHALDILRRSRETD